MRLRRIPQILACFAISILVFSSGCVQNGSFRGDVDESFIDEANPEPLKSGKFFKEAETFDRWIKGKLSKSESSRLISQCRKKSNKNPFCFSILRPKRIAQAKNRRSGLKLAIPQREVKPYYARYKNGKFLNWNQLRKADVQRLLEGLLRVPKKQLKVMAKKALREKRCPNRIAIAVAATMEDLLPSTSYSQIARLYEKGGYCTRKRTRDREHYLTRAGLFYYYKKDYKSAARVLSRIQPQDFYSGRVRYWLYHSQIRLGQVSKAKRTLERLISKHPLSFHTAVALATTPANEIFGSQQPKVMKRSKKSRALNKLIDQAETLYKYGFRESAALIIDYALAVFPRTPFGLRLYLAALSDAYGKVTILPPVLMLRPRWATERVLRLYFPIDYYPEVATQESKVDPLLLLSIARKESEFNPKAISRANAKGLMQINPDTAEKMTGRSNLDLLDIETNVELGATYLNKVLALSDGQLPVALASYNAGEEAALSWTYRYPTEDPILFVDLVPYRETRDYVGFVLNNYYWYQRLYADNGRNFMATLLSRGIQPTDGGSAIAKK